MLKKLNTFVAFDYNNCNSWEFETNNFEDTNAENVFVIITEDEELVPKKNKSKKMDNFEITKEHNEITTLQTSISNKILTRTVPNILKHHRVRETVPTEVDIVPMNAEINTEIPFDSTTIPDRQFFEQESIKKEGKRKKKSHKRKEHQSFSNRWHELPSWSIYSSTDNKQGTLNENLFKASELRNTSGEKELKCIKKHSRRHKVSTVKNEQTKELLFPVSYDVFMDSPPDFQSFYALQEIEDKNLQDSVDFSSNEIFSTYNYELYDVNKLDYLNSEETYTSLSTIYNNDIYETQFDINGNKNQHEKADCLSNTWCSSCLNDYTIDCTMTSGLENHTFTKDKVLTETLNENLVNNEYQVYFNCLDSHVTNTSINDDALKKCNIETSLTIDTEVFPQYLFENIELPSTDLSTFYEETHGGKNIVVESNNTIQENEYVFNEFNEHYQLDELDYILGMCQNQMRRSCNEDMLQTQTKRNKNSKEFQCLLCPLKFSSARTMAMHQAGAHGGMYVILCESCGRLFNRKYHFNRHFIYCGRIKEPYKCDMCMKTYRHKSSLVHHLKIAHHVHYTRNRSTTYTCSVCKKVYSKFGAFENHVKRHKENAW
ncbi:uncharacterized protein LOC143182070 [Calliopsis andreniformis]|uniref:uncharacterized protein LOC143182070 n=1 Tax=Calliopsis andreniformis TaxID=337506 RepID=UPI003FCD12AB